LYLIKSGFVLESGIGFNKKDVLIQNGKIKKIDENIAQSEEEDCEVLDAEDFWVVPGLIDIHTHGAMGIDFMDAGYSELKELSVFYASKGVTSFLATTMTDSIERIKDALKNIHHAINKGVPGARIVGVNMEGPFINPDYRGAHPKEYIIMPTLGLIEEFIKSSGNNIRLITIAPELEGVKEITQKLLKEGITIAAGHSGIDFIGAESAFNNGFGHVTHLFNAMTGMHHRKPGLVGAALDTENVTVEIIPDGIHVHPSVVRSAIKCKTCDRTVLITDSIAAAGAGYENLKLKFAGEKIMIKDGAAVFDNGVLAGSTITMIDGVKNMVQRMGIDLGDAIKMASENPAKVIGIFDRTGTISEGKDADVIILDKGLRVRTTITGGIITYRG
jgi:N-acetylglucosamine-6-phosphate deacetylase